MIWWTQDLSALTTARPEPAASFAALASAEPEAEGDARTENVTPIRRPGIAPCALHPDAATPCSCSERLAS